MEDYSSDEDFSGEDLSDEEFSDEEFSDDDFDYLLNADSYINDIYDFCDCDSSEDTFYFFEDGNFTNANDYREEGRKRIKMSQEKQAKKLRTMTNDVSNSRCKNTVSKIQCKEHISSTDVIVISDSDD